jgi:hypothetical protein
LIDSVGSNLRRLNKRSGKGTEMLKRKSGFIAVAAVLASVFGSAALAET